MTTSHVAAHSTAWHLDLGEPVMGIHLQDNVLAIGGTEGAIVMADTDGAKRLRMTLGDFLLAMAVSPDGTRLAAGGSDRFAVFDLVDGSVLAERPIRWCGCLAWAAHSRDLAASDGRSVQLFTRDGRLRWTSPPMPSTVAGLAWMRADGRRVAAAAYRGVTILEPGTDRIVEVLDAPGAIAGLAVAPTGRWVVGGSQDATLHGWNMRDRSDFRMSGFPTRVSRLAFESSGRWMACDGGDTLSCWDFSGPGPIGREALLAEGHRGQVTALAWAPTDRKDPLLVSGDDAGEVALWRLRPNSSPGQRIRPMWINRTDDPVGAVAVRGERIVTGHRSGAVRAHSVR